MKKQLRILIILMLVVVGLYAISAKPYEGGTISQKKSLMIVAHPDDEMLWGGNHLLQGNYYVVCLTNGNNEVRSKEFYDILKKTNSEGIILNYPDKLENKRSTWTDEEQKIKTTLRKIIAKEDWDMIVTHNPQGEYGHIQHKKTSKLVSSIVEEKHLEDNLYYFGKYYKNVDAYLAPKTLTNVELEKKKQVLMLYKSQRKVIKKLSHMNESECFRKSKNAQQKCY